MGRWPHFIGIGGHKCGSTWLAECMRLHPQICMSHPKELHFFTDHWERGSEWYREKFSDCRNDQVSGEFCTHYLYDSEVPTRIERTVGRDVKLLVIFRDPIERALSEFKHGMRLGILNVPDKRQISVADLSVAEALYPEVLNWSRYSSCLDDFRVAFGSDNIQVIPYPLIVHDPRNVLERVFRFLDVDPTFVPEIASSWISAGNVPRIQTLESFRIGVYKFFNRHYPRLIPWVRRSGLAELYRRFNNRKFELGFTKEAEAHLLSSLGSERMFVENLTAEWQRNAVD
jgi:hypothetical protein